MNHSLFEDDLDSKLNATKLKSEIADYAAKDAESYKKVQDIMAKAYKQRINDKNQLIVDHPVISAIEQGVKTGKSMFVNMLILSLILGLVTGRLNSALVKELIERVAKMSAKASILVAGIAIPFNYLYQWLDKRNKNNSNESLGLKLLNKMNNLSRCICEDDDEDDGDDEAEDLDDKIEDQLEGDEPEETSEALKKLRGHLYRFQEKEDEPSVTKSALGGAVLGGTAGNKIARKHAAKVSGADKAIAATKASMKEPAKNLKYFSDKAMKAKTQSKIAKAMGQADKAKKLQKVANASANAANKAGKALDVGNKTIRGIGKALNAAGRRGIVKGAIMGAGALGAAAAAKKMSKEK